MRKGLGIPQAIVGAVGIIGTAFVLLLHAMRGTGEMWGAVLAGVLSAPPWFLYVVIIRTRFGKIATACLMYIATAWLIILTLRSESGQAGFGYIVSIFVNLVIVGLGSIREIWIDQRSPGTHAS